MTEFVLTPEQQAQWEAVNDRPARDLPSLRWLMERPSPWSPNSGDVIELTPAEYESALAKTLKRAGVTYEGLEAQARFGTFTSPSLAGLWALIRHTGRTSDRI